MYLSPSRLYLSRSRTNALGADFLSPSYCTGWGGGFRDPETRRSITQPAWGAVVRAQAPGTLGVPPAHRALGHPLPSSAPQGRGLRLQEAQRGSNQHLSPADTPLL